MDHCSSRGCNNDKIEGHLLPTVIAILGSRLPHKKCIRMRFSLKTKGGGHQLRASVNSPVTVRGILIVYLSIFFIVYIGPSTYNSGRFAVPWATNMQTVSFEIPYKF